MERTGTRGGPGLYIPRDPNDPGIYDESYTGPPSLYVDPVWSHDFARAVECAHGIGGP